MFNSRKTIFYTLITLLVILFIVKIYKNDENFDININNGKKQPKFYNNKCTVQQTEQDLDSYIRSQLLVNSNSCDNKKLANYRDRHFGFRDKIWQTSNDIDMVDKINDMYLSGNQDLSRNHNGLLISDIFNGLTQNNTDNKMKPTEHEVLLQHGHNGYSLSDIIWTYDNNEKPMNGGSFYNNITAFDNNGQLNQSVLY